MNRKPKLNAMLPPLSVYIFVIFSMAVRYTFHSRSLCPCTSGNSGNLLGGATPQQLLLQTRTFLPVPYRHALMLVQVKKKGTSKTCASLEPDTWRSAAVSESASSTDGVGGIGDGRLWILARRSSSSRSH